MDEQAAYRKAMRKRWEKLAARNHPLWKQANPFEMWLLETEHRIQQEARQHEQAARE